MIRHLTLRARRHGLHDITAEVAGVLHDTAADNGLCTLFIRHTSASLIIQENADPSAQHDLEQWLNRLVAENDPLYTHTYEGPDDMPSHIKSILTATSLSIPIVNGKLALGTWQGIYLWEHRHQPTPRQLVLHIAAD